MKRFGRVVWFVGAEALALFGFAACSLPVSANDGGIAYGGSPGLLKGHPSVSMTSEVIRLEVGEETVKVDCQFVFTNHGDACTVRMGFPDEGYGEADPDEEAGENVMKTPPKTTFLSFRSFVNGKPVATKLIRADEPGKFWHAKTVTFPAHGVVRIHDVYTQRIGGGIFSAKGKEGTVRQVGYILHTGASWHGAIGRSEISVTFNKGIAGTPRLASLHRLAAVENGIMSDGRHLKGDVPTIKTIVWRGPGTPTVKGKTLRWVRTNWTPKPSDDIDLTYAYRTLLNSAGN